MKELSTWMKELPLESINRLSNEIGVPPELVMAICQVESGGDQYAVRYENGYRYLFEVEQYAKRLHISEATERVLQQMSFSYMQIMGGTSRWLGYSDSLMKLCSEETGLKYGMMYLKRCLRTTNSRSEAISKYNAGHVFLKDGKLSNQAYVDKVEGYVKELEGCFSS